MSRPIAVAIVAGVLITCAFLPFERIVAPDWSVVVVDERGQPLVNAAVRESWQDYSVQNHGNEETVFTDMQGKAHFHARRIRKSEAAALSGCLSQIMQTGVHASCGPHSHVFAMKSGYSDKDLSNYGGDTMSDGSFPKSTRLVLTTCSSRDEDLACGFAGRKQ
jgi:hypothetical protein